MLLRLRADLADKDRAAILAEARSLGYRAHAVGERGDLLELIGRGAPEHRARLTDLFGVAEVLDPGDARELALRPPGAEARLVHVGPARFGVGHVSLVAGPCAVESEERTLEIAHAVRRAGGVLLRGGAFKPRTSPYSFQGLGEAGLDILGRVRAAVGIGVVTEVLDPRDVEAVAQVADMLQVGARNMANYPLLREVGRAGVPVLLKRGFGARVGELLGAAEYVLAEGNEDVVLCERGVRGFDDVTRDVLDVGAVAHLSRASSLPVVVDPSHAAGRSDLVRALARAGLAAGADGLLVEVHPEPGEARSDGAQAVSVEELERIAGDARALAELDGRRLVTLESESQSIP